MMFTRGVVILQVRWWPIATQTHQKLVVFELKKSFHLVLE